MSTDSPITPPARPDRTMRAALVAVLAVALCFAVVAGAFFGAHAGLGTVIGGALATANLWVLSRVGQAFIEKRGSVPWGVIAVLKFLALFGGVFLLLKSGFVPWVSLVAGYAALPFGITFASLFGPAPAESDAVPERDVVQGKPSDVGRTVSARPHEDPRQGPSQ